MMRVLAWTGGLLLCLLALHGARYLKWPAHKDPFFEIEKMAAILRPQISQERLTTIQISGVPEDYMLFMRYELLPARVSFALRPDTRNLILISLKDRIHTASDSVCVQTSAVMSTTLQEQQLGASLFKLK